MDQHAWNERSRLELIPSAADLARARLPHLADPIDTGEVATWVDVVP